MCFKNMKQSSREWFQMISIVKIWLLFQKCLIFHCFLTSSHIVDAHVLSEQMESMQVINMEQVHTKPRPDAVARWPYAWHKRSRVGLRPKMVCFSAGINGNRTHTQILCLRNLKRKRRETAEELCKVYHYIIGTLCIQGNEEKPLNCDVPLSHFFTTEYYATRLPPFTQSIAQGHPSRYRNSLTASSDKMPICWK